MVKLSGPNKRAAVFLIAGSRAQRDLRQKRAFGRVDVFLGLGHALSAASTS